MSQRESVMDLVAAAHAMLDAMDYTAGACRVNEMVGAVVSLELIAQLKEAAKSASNEFQRP